MRRVIEGYTRAAAAASASQGEDDVLVGTLELPDAARQQQQQQQQEEEETSDEERNRLEQAARSSILASGHAAQPSAACFDLRGVFHSLGATGQPKVLRITDLKAAVIRVGLAEREAAAVSFPTKDSSTLATDAAAGRVAARIVGSGGDGLDFRSFEDWLMPPRGLTELRGVLIELMEEGSALGLTPAELFLQFCGEEDGDDKCDGVGRLALREGLGALSVHLTETEVETVMAGAGCRTDNDDPRMTFSLFEALLKNPSEKKQVLAVSTLEPPDGDRGAVTCTAVVAAQPSSTRNVENKSVLPERREDGGVGSLVEDGGVSPDSLALMSSPRLPSSSKLGRGEQGGGGGSGDGIGSGSGSSSAAAHVEAFGRVAADVQAVLATAVSSGGGTGGGGSQGDFIDRGSGATSKSFGQSTNVNAEPGPTSENEWEARRAQGGSEVGQPPTKLGTATGDGGGDSGPVPRTRAITPPLGPARSPSEPLHPTRASRERLKAALENLDLKECLRPATGECKPAIDGGGEGNSARFAQSAPLSPRRIPSAAVGGTKKKEQGVTGSVLCVQPGEGGGYTGGDGLAATARARRVPAEVARKGPRSSHRDTSYGVEVGGGGHGGVDRSGEKQHLGRGEGGGRGRGGGRAVAASVGRESRESAFEDSRNAPETIGRLRARVAELELTEQLLRYELEAAHADLATDRRRATDEAAKEAERACNRERALQAKMGARLRATQAEAAATEKRMAEYKRSSVAEAVAREKSSAEYLRRRLKEVEMTLEAKAARVSAKQQKNPSGRRRLGRRGEDGMSAAGGPNGGDSDGVGSGGGGVNSGNRREGVERPRRRTRALGGMVAGVGDKDNDNLIRRQLDACRKKLAIATAEASRLRKQASISRGVDREKGEPERRAMLEGGGTPLSEKAFCVCGERNISGGNKETTMLIESHEIQRRRERVLEDRLAESEDARIEVEAEAGRLQAFLDEMRGLGPPVLHNWRGQDRAAE